MHASRSDHSFRVSNAPLSCPQHVMLQRMVLPDTAFIAGFATLAAKTWRSLTTFERHDMLGLSTRSDIELFTSSAWLTRVTPTNQRHTVSA